MGSQCLLKRCQTHVIRTKYGALLSSTARPSQSGYLSNEMFPRYGTGNIQSPRATSLCQIRLGCGMIEFEKHAFFIGYRPRIESSYGFKGNPLLPPRTIRTVSDLFGNNTEREPQLNRDYFVQLWVSDKRMNQYHEKRRRKLGKQKESSSISYTDKSPLQNLAERLFSNGSSVSGSSDPSRQIPHQPPPSQSVMLELASPEEVLVASLLARSNLLITRDIEWANLVLGFEQENRYVIVDVCYPQSPVGYIREQSNVFVRQLLRLRRPFKAYITDAMGNEVYRVRRPFWWITSSIYAEIDGKEVGVVHQRWHLWKRVYDLYIGKEQFAVVENPGFWNWTFTLKGKDGEVLAEIDRDWRGFGLELFTDAGQYVIRFGSSDPSLKTGRATQIQELEVARPLSISERAVALALAISLDNDYFSRHGGWGIPFVVVGE